MNNNLLKKVQFNLSYGFVYDNENDFMKQLEKNKFHPGNLLSFVDRIFDHTKTINLKTQDKNDDKFGYLYVCDEKINNLYKLKINKLYIKFFDNKFAFVNINLEILQYITLERLYELNYLLTNTYTKKSNSYIHIASSNDSETKYKEKFESIKDNIKILKDNIEIFDPYKTEDGKSIPFNCELSEQSLYGTEKYFKGRVGPYGNEELESIKNNQNNQINRHYLYLKKQMELMQDYEKGKFYFIHIDTFLSSCILEYLKCNKSLYLYDNFNPIATSYINNYISLCCNHEFIQDEYKNNFVSFEPLLSNKKKKGKTINKADFFNIYQSQADIVSLGNSHNIVHIIDENSKNMLDVKNTDHFYVYQLTQYQRMMLLSMVNSSILNIQKTPSLSLKNFSNIFKKDIYVDFYENILKYSCIRKIYNYLNKDDTLDINETSSEKSCFSTIKQFLHIYKSILGVQKDHVLYLTNIDFSIISNNSSLDHSYNFFKKCNQIDLIDKEVSKLSKELEDSKKVFYILFGIYAGPILLILIYVISMVLGL